MARVYVREYFDPAITPWSDASRGFFIPNDDFIVYSDMRGFDVYFSDHSWPLLNRETSMGGRAQIHVKYKNEPTTYSNEDNVRQSKSILLALDRHAFKKPGEPLSVASINRYNLALQHVRRYATDKDLTLFQVLSSHHHCTAAYLQYRSNAKVSSSALPDLLAKLSLLPFRYVGFKPAMLPKDVSDEGSQNAAEYHQTDVIPTAIYFTLLNEYRTVVREFLVVKQSFEDLAVQVSLDPKYGRSGSFDKVLEKHGILHYAQQYGVSSVKQLSRHFARVNYCSIMLIHAFTGMRASEAYSLKLTSLKRTVNNGVVTRRGLAGFTTKHFGKRKKVIWYTSADIEEPFEAASFISRLIMRCNGIAYSDQYVFISCSYFPFSSMTLDMSTICTDNPIRGNYAPKDYQRDFNTPKISEADIQELKLVNPFRNWDIERKYSVGLPWPLKIHQMRRSTALYAIGSGIVSLPALKEILKHITLVMSRYYSGGSSYAPDIIKRSKGDSDALVFRYQETEVFMKALQYVNELIIPDEVLHGAGGVWIERNSKEKLKSLSYAECLETTFTRMRKGLISYRPSPVGGCMKDGACTNRITVNIVGCSGCSEAAISAPKLLKVIQIQEKMVQEGCADDNERHFEQQTLSELKEFALAIGVCG